MVTKLPNTVWAASIWSKRGVTVDARYAALFKALQRQLWLYNNGYYDY